MTQLAFVLRSQLAEALGWTLVHMLWEGALIAGALAAVLVASRSPEVRYRAACISLLATLVSFSITLLHFLPENVGARGISTSFPLPAWSPHVFADGARHRFPELAVLVPWLAPLWLLGVSLFYIRYAAGWLSSCRLRRRGLCNPPERWRQCVTRLAADLRISRPVRLLESLLTDTPVVLGHFRPVVLVPLGFLTGLSPDHVEAILLHELAHIRRSDYFVNICQRLIEGLLFYHPAVWWISNVIRAEREHCCDDLVVALRGDSHGYAMALAALEQNRLEESWLSRHPAIAARGGNLMKRVKRLLYPKRPTGVWAPVLGALVLIANAAAVLAAWHVSPSGSSAFQQTERGEDSSWQKWLNQDVVYIISEQERHAFENLKTDEERQQFVEQFWARRDPTPGTPENEFKQEHYRRIGYANDHFGAHMPGWKTDRGRIYIRYGPPDEIESHPSGGSYKRPESEGSGWAMTYPFEDWRYAHFEGVGSLIIEFVDKASSGDFRMTLDPNEKYRQP